MISARSEEGKPSQSETDGSAIAKGVKAAPPKYQFVDSLRGIAILIVIIYHTGVPNGPGWLKILYDQGTRGVQLFFLVSGFTLYLSLSNRKTNETGPIRNYFIRRIFRILPAFYCGVILYLLWSRLLDPDPAWLDSNTLANRDLVGYGLTFLPFLACWHWPSIRTRIPGGWSIAIETMFYIFLPFIFKKVRTFSSAVWFTAAMVVLAEASEKLLLPFFTQLYGERWGLFYLQLWLPSQMAYFGFGFVFYFWFVAPDRQMATQKIIKFVGICLGVVALVTLGLLVVYRSHFYHEAVVLMKTPLKLAYGLFFLGFAMWLCEKTPKFLVNRFTAFMGIVSYSAYLLHFLMIRLTRIVIPNPTFFQSVFLVLPAVVAMTAATAYVSYKYLETPFNNLGKKIIGKLEARRVPSHDIEGAL